MRRPQVVLVRVGYRCGGWVIGLLINQFYEIHLGNFGVWTVVAFALLAAYAVSSSSHAQVGREKDEHILDNLAEEPVALVTFGQPFHQTVGRPSFCYLCSAPQPYEDALACGAHMVRMVLK